MRGGDHMKLFIVSVMALFTFFLSAPHTFAQGTSTDTNTYSDTITGTDSSGTLNNGTDTGSGTGGTSVGSSTNTATASDTDDNTRWLWLLPLLAIPVIYYIWKRSDKNADRPATNYSR
jgi:hypothetical protein